MQFLTTKRLAKIPIAFTEPNFNIANNISSVKFKTNKLFRDKNMCALRIVVTETSAYCRSYFKGAVI